MLVIATYNPEMLRQIVRAFVGDNILRIQLHCIPEVRLKAAIIRRPGLSLIAVVINVGRFISIGLLKLP